MTFHAGPKMDLPTALEILSLPSNPTLAEVKKAYREQVKLWHPDRYSNGSAIKDIAEKNIQDANIAYAFLKRHLPTIPKSVSPGPPQTIHNRRTQPISFVIPKLIDRSIQLLETLSQRFPSIRFSQLLKWLQPDARNHYRPWYRYPPSTEPEQKRRENINFDQVLRKAMGNRSQRNPRHMRRSSSHKFQEDRVPPVNGVSKSVKTNRT